MLSRIVETEADSEDAAVEKVRQMYQNCDIILDASDYVGTKIFATVENFPRKILQGSNSRRKFASQFASMRIGLRGGDEGLKAITY